MLQGGTAIPENADMDNYNTPGNYYCIDNTTAATLQNVPFELGFVLKVDYALGAHRQRQTFINYYTQQKAVRAYDGSKWTDYVYFSDDATVIESAIESAIKNYQIQSQEADSPFNIPLEIGAYIVSLSQYGSWENTTAMYIVFLSTDPQTSYIEKITSHALLDALDIQMGDDHQSIDVYNTTAATMKVSAFKVGGFS